ncbi:hypothetical protein [Qipengyuania nanhaisediminis]|uniref:hypothetical protein n=1 Tax=Qipengyuania nanhaisediminis TaxID=604088 RepID=UPI0038B2FAFC
MNIYDAARRHARFMAGVLVLGVLFVMVVDQFFGHSAIAFGIAIVALVFANRRMLEYNCTVCGRNLFAGGFFLFPRRKCSQCGTELDKLPRN